MAEYLDRIPPDIQSHLHEVTRTSGLPDNDDSFRKIAKNWADKEKLFEQQIKALDMEEIGYFSREELRGAIILTYSGSLVSLGRVEDGVRWAEYASIKLRKNVPELKLSSDARIAHDIRLKDYIEFTQGPIRRTSAVLKIAVCSENVPIEEQEKRIREGTMFLTHGFVTLNRTIVEIPIQHPEHFTMKSMVSCLAEKHEMPEKHMKEIVDDFLLIVESGMLLGERVPLGKIGKLYLKNRPAQKARVRRNPSSGEEMTVEAKPETATPRISFSKYMKERAATVVVDR